MAGGGSQMTAEHAQTERRHAMVAEQIEGRGIHDPDVLAALRGVPRHLFVPAGLADRAYDDGALAIGYGQTISQPYIVALMTELAEVNVRSRVLEVGSGSGYQTAVLAELAGEVYTIERRRELEERARELLTRLGYHNVTTVLGRRQPRPARAGAVRSHRGDGGGARAAAAAPRPARRGRPPGRADRAGRRRPDAHRRREDGRRRARGREHPLPVRAAGGRERLSTRRRADRSREGRGCVKAVSVCASGRVQGVYFRVATRQMGERLGLRAGCATAATARSRAICRATRRPSRPGSTGAARGRPAPSVDRLTWEPAPVDTKLAGFSIRP